MIGGIIISIVLAALFFNFISKVIIEKHKQVSKESFSTMVNTINSLCGMNVGQSITQTLVFSDIVDKLYVSKKEEVVLESSTIRGNYLCMNISNEVTCQRLGCPVEMTDIIKEETVLSLLDKLMGRFGYKQHQLEFSRIKCDNNITCCGINCKNVTDTFHDGSKTKFLSFFDSRSNSDAKIKIPKDYNIRSSRFVVSKHGFNESYIFIANSGEDTVSKLRTSDGSLICKYPVGDNPSRTAVGLNLEVWVGNRNSNDVTRLNGSSCEVIGTYPVGKAPRGVAIDLDGNVWVGNSGDNNVMKLDGRTGEILGTYPVGNFPYGALTDYEGNIWIVNRKSDSLTKLNPDGYEIGTYHVPGANFYGIGIDSKGNIWVAGYKPGNVYKINGKTGELLGTYHIGGGPRGVAVDNNDNVWVADSKRNLVHKVGPEGKLIGSYPVGAGPVGVAVDFDGNIWVVNRESDDATKLKSSDGSVLGTYPVGRGPYTYSDMTGYNLRRVSFDIELDIGSDGIIEWNKKGVGVYAKIFDYNTKPELKKKLMNLARICDCSGCLDDGLGCTIDLNFSSGLGDEIMVSDLCICAGTCDPYENPCVTITPV